MQINLSTLKGLIRGEVFSDEDTLNEVRTDFGRVVSGMPRAVVIPASPEDVCTTIKLACREGWPISVRGTSSSQGGQSLSRGGLLLDMGALNAAAPIRRGTVWVQAGLLLSDLVRLAAEQDLQPPVLPSYLEVTVGGLVSTGGFGACSQRSGLLVEHVDELEVVTGEGHLVRCSLRDNPELFAGAKGGLGQLAVIVRAKLRLREVARQVRGYYLLYDDLERLVRDFELLMVEQRFHYIEAFGVPCHLGFKRAGEAALEFGEWFYPVRLSVEFSGVPPSDEAMLSGLGYRRKSYVEDAVAADFAFRHESLFDLWRRVGSWGQAHPWVETVLPWEKALPYVEGVLRSLPPSLLGGGSVTLRPRRPTQAELPFLRQPEGKYVLDFGILPALSKQSLQMALPLLKKAGELGSDVGGKRLLSGWVDFDDSQWREHFGTFWDGLRERKRFYDPRGILNPSLVQYGDLNA